MAVITEDTFNPLRHFVAVRLQQGVPLVDADWNELDDVRRFEVRAFLKWFMGDGVPAGNDTAFRIEGTGLENDFKISAGVTGTPDALVNVGRILADGRDAIITTDMRFRDQPLHEDQPGAAALSDALGVPQIAKLTLPAVNGDVVAYLDMWDQLVTPTEEPDLVLPGIGTESCARLKREWVVRVRDGAAVPVAGNDDFLKGHSYLPLATIARVTGQASVNVKDVSDRRRLGLSFSRIETLERLTLVPVFVASPNQFDPKRGPAGLQPVTLTGRNFLVGIELPMVTVGGKVAEITGKPTSTELQVIVPADAPQGLQKITVTHLGGKAESLDTFDVESPAPAFAEDEEFSPPNATINQTVTLFGKNFHVTGLIVKFGTKVAEVQGEPTETKIECRVPSMPEGEVHITVTTSEGSVTSTRKINVVI